MPGINKGFDYARSNNPTRQALEDLIAELENGHSGFAFASGLAAVDAVLKLLSSGDEIVAVDDIYGGSYRCFTHIYEKFGVKVNYVDATEPENVLNAITDKTKFIWLESPTNPTLKICDIKTIAKIGKKSGCITVVDNTFASPALQTPLDLSADIVIHSATKYLGGHSDLIAGLVVCKTKELSEQIKFNQNATGGILGPFDSWLTIRGIQTLQLRVDRQCENTVKIAEWLNNHPAVDTVFFSGLSKHKNHDIATAQQKQYGAMISFNFKDDREQNAVEFVRATNLFKLAESLGGVKSLICVPSLMTHKSTPREKRLAAGISDSLVRLSVGIEGAEDLINDLEGAFAAVKTNQTKREVLS